MILLVVYSSGQQSPTQWEVAAFCYWMRMTEYYASRMTICATMIKNLQTVSLTNYVDSMQRVWHSIKWMYKRQDIYSSSGLGTRLALVHARTKQPAWIYGLLKLWRPWPLQELKMEERVATSLYYSLILDYRVLCDEQSTFAFYGDKSFKL